MDQASRVPAILHARQGKRLRTTKTAVAHCASRCPLGLTHHPTSHSTTRWMAGCPLPTPHPVSCQGEWSMVNGRRLSTRRISNPPTVNSTVYIKADANNIIHAQQK